MDTYTTLQNFQKYIPLVRDVNTKTTSTHKPTREAVQVVNTL